jgi:hypothetical protein
LVDRGGVFRLLAFVLDSEHVVGGFLRGRGRLDEELAVVLQDPEPVADVARAVRDVDVDTGLAAKKRGRHLGDEFLA